MINFSLKFVLQVLYFYLILLFFFQCGKQTAPFAYLILFLSNFLLNLSHSSPMLFSLIKNSVGVLSQNYYLFCWILLFYVIKLMLNVISSILHLGLTGQGFVKSTSLHFFPFGIEVDIELWMLFRDGLLTMGIYSSELKIRKVPNVFEELKDSYDLRLIDSNWKVMLDF